MAVGQTDFFEAEYLESETAEAEAAEATKNDGTEAVKTQNRDGLGEFWPTAQP